MHKLVKGWGINDSPYKVWLRDKEEDLWKCPIYIKWCSMLNRCYGKKYQEGKPTYIEKSVCEEWRYFSKFREWMLNEQSLDENGNLFHLDKDLLLINNNEYNPESCCFLPNDVNGFMTKRKNCRGDLPLGVSINKTLIDGSIKYKAVISNVRDTNKRGSLDYLGQYTTPVLAHQAWQKAKIKTALMLKDKYSYLHKVTKGLQRVIDKIQHDLDNNLITEDF